MVELKVKLILCDNGNKRQKSKYMSSLDDKVLSYDLAQSLYGCASTIQMKKLSALESLQSSLMAQLDGGELQLCSLLTQYCDTQKTNLT